MLALRLQQRISWFTLERREWLAAVAVSALLGFGLGNGHTTKGAVQHISEQLGTEKKEAGCEHHRADVTVKVAKQAIVSANSDVVPTPSTQAIPKDCPNSAMRKE